ncbi:uncharacterized protein BX663DRAFT_483263 [Cokeromyces recurvatus]|uniref:uncharacterized protein n=1 Tax=Cokeromyces recurvatus TaxID=90255 RepID=UPI00222069C1|nr:uncharacterized protein BX663DRAFT_483263 [Cokeromyces recurvatus]KAI7906532.1 hypothetical protein BX663DRAFT_483263 [Cokeromyces recurvatus]
MKSNSIPNEILNKIFSYIPENELKDLLKSLKLVCKSWNHCVNLLYPGITVTLYDNQFDMFYKDLQKSSLLGTHPTNYGYEEQDKQLISILQACPNIKKIFIHIGSAQITSCCIWTLCIAAGYLKNVQRILIQLGTDCLPPTKGTLIHIFNNISICLRNRLTSIEIKEGNVLLIFNRSPIDLEYSEIKDISHLQLIKFDIYVGAGEVSIFEFMPLFEEHKMLKGIELSGFSGLELFSERSQVLLDKASAEPYDSLEHLEIRAWIIHINHLRFLMRKFKKLKYLKFYHNFGCTLDFDNECDRSYRSLQEIRDQLVAYSKSIDYVNIRLYIREQGRHKQIFALAYAHSGSFDILKIIFT